MTSRYYEEKDNEIKPGSISAELRAALNLAENDVPIWIYRMRALGYPPGWLNKAIVDTSDIFDTDSATADANESGKRKDAPDNGPQYDHSKLIEYPGFNTPLPPETQDYHYYYNMPPMLPHQQLDYAKTTMSSFKQDPMPPQKRSRSSTSSDQKAKIREFDKSLNEDSSSGSSGEEDEDEEDENEDESPDSPDADGNTSGNDKTNTSKTSIQSQNNSSRNAASANQSSASLNLSNLSEGIKLVSKGSPMPKPVDRLPLERFSEGVVGELLYFENIPNSTGKFDSLRGLLNTMRQSRSSDVDLSFGLTTSSNNNNGNNHDKSDSGSKKDN